MDNAEGGSIIQYVPFKSFVDPSFWFWLTEQKLNVDQLRETTRPLYGRFCFRDDVGPVFEVDGTSFNSEAQTENFYANVYGTIMNKNTIEDFKNIDKGALLNGMGEVVKMTINDGVWISKPSKLLSFFILTFADLKKFHYYYWFAFLSPSQPTAHLSKHTSITEHFDENQQSTLVSGHKALGPLQQSFFVIKKKDITIEPISQVLEKDELGKVVLKCDLSEIMFGFLDSSINDNPGWSLRNFLAALALCPSLTQVDLPILGLRCSPTGGIGKSRVFTVNIPDVCEAKSGGWLGWERNDNGSLGPRLANMAAAMDPVKLADAAADLNVRLMKWRLVPSLEPAAMARCRCLLLGAGTLGCHVARGLLAWGFRHITFVDSGRVSHSNPPRQTLFRHAHVGQPKAAAAAAALKDILPTVKSRGVSLHIPMPGRPAGAALRVEREDSARALAAEVARHDAVFLLLDTREARWLPAVIAASMSKIVINAALGFDSYLVMRHGIRNMQSIPDSAGEATPGDDEPGEAKPGVDDAAGGKPESDETEESKPGSVTAEEGKPGAVDAAKDKKKETTGQAPPGPAEPGTSRGEASVPGSQLGCYFCNDVTAPGNSLADRTLDQQCTVSRPGAAAVAAALAVEVLVGLLQHPLRGEAPAFIEPGAAAAAAEGALGAVPHSVRGFLHSYETLLPTCRRFAQCVACSDAVLAAYRARAERFVLRVCDSGQYLEQLTGLAELQMHAEMSDIVALSDDEDIE